MTFGSTTVKLCDQLQKTEGAQTGPFSYVRAFRKTKPMEMVGERAFAEYREKRLQDDALKSVVDSEFAMAIVESRKEAVRASAKKARTVLLERQVALISARTETFDC